jgi:hypothetical protein
MMQEDPPPSPPQSSPWAQAAQRAQAASPAKPARHEMWTSVGLGALAGAGGVLLLGALLVMLGR